MRQLILCIAYKPNLAFYESMGVKGWIAFEKTVKYIKDNYPDQFIIADAKTWRYRKHFRYVCPYFLRRT